MQKVCVCVCVHHDYNDQLLLDIIDDIKAEKEEYNKFLLCKKSYEPFLKTPEKNLMIYMINNLKFLTCWMNTNIYIHAISNTNNPKWIS